MAHTIRSSILARTAILVLGVALGIGLVTSEMVVRLARTMEETRVQDEIQGLLAVVEPSARVACFVGDRRLADETAKGLLNSPSLGAVEIRDNENVLAIALRPGVRRAGAAVTLPLLSPFSAGQRIGQIQVLPDADAIERRVAHYVWMLRGLVLLLAAVVGAALAWTVARIVVRPIKHLSDQLHDLVPTQGMRMQSPTGHTNDEIGRLVDDVNNLVDKLAEAVKEEHNLRLQEDAVRQAQKLESLGVLAGGIAHDFNNMLSAMLGNLNLAQMKVPPGAPPAKYLANMEAIIGKAGGLCRQMLAYSGRGRFVVEPVVINSLVRGITELMAASISKRCHLEFDLAPDLPPIEADATQIQQVLMNLVTNASDAISADGGVITLRTRLRTLDLHGMGPALAKQDLEPGTYVALTVEDNGCGMAPEALARIFDPFFTTKGAGRGLGLSAMLGILRGHKAGIEISSELGKGSAFEVLFRATDSRPPALEGDVPADHHGRFQGKVLLVDDEPEVRESFGEMLQIMGFEVVEAQDGLEALDRFQPATYSLVFMDLTMPRMDGRTAFLQMLARDPEAKVVIVSGYSEQEAFGTLGGTRPSAFIQKPFAFQDLQDVLERVLSRASGS